MEKLKRVGPPFEGVGRGESTAPRIIILDIGQVLSPSRFCRFISGENPFLYPLKRSLGGLQRRSRRGGIETIRCLCL